MSKSIIGLQFALMALLSANLSAADQAFAARYQLKTLEKISVRQLPPLDLTEIQAQDASDVLNDVSPRFALPVAVDVSPNNAGTWEIAADGRQVWRYRVRSEVASDRKSVV